MLIAARAVQRYVAGRGRSDLDDDEFFQHALVRQLEILGEAATHIDAATRAAHPAVPWRDLVGMRNVLIHAYHRVDLDVVWSAANNEVPALTVALEAVIATLGDPGADGEA
jgi:uncharacterized protein with HEPN domain